MESERTTTEILSRFRDEQASVAEYVDFLRSASAIPTSTLTRLNSLLARHELPTYPFGTEQTAQVTIERLPSLLAWVWEVSPQVEEAVEKMAKRFAAHKHPSCRIDRRYGSMMESPLAATGQFLQELQEAAELLASMRFMGRMSNPTATIHVLRQGFILLMTAFDAAVFDLVRVAFRKHFFRLVAVFGKKESVSMDRLAESGSLEAFRDQVIEEQLKRKYLKEVLALLQSLDVRCAAETAGQTFAHLVEIVQRRNIHVHNRGVVDERYLERDAGGKVRFNLYRLKLGDVAHIDEAYWDQANILCDECIYRIAAWAEGRAADPVGTNPDTLIPNEIDAY